jgi:hypothetical protein
MKRNAKFPMEMLRADLVPLSIDEEKLTMDAVVAVHGFEYQAFNWSLGDHIQKLDLHTGLDVSRATDGAMPLLYNHEIDIGIVPEMSMDGDNLKATLQFSEHEELGVKLFKRYKEKTIRKFSVGLAPSTLTLLRVDEGSGQKVYLAQNIKVFEVTATGMPRNPKTYVLGRQRAEALEYECTIIDGEDDPMKTIPTELVLHLTKLKIEHALSDEFFQELLSKENMTKGDYSELVLSHVKGRNNPPSPAPGSASDPAPQAANLSLDVVMYLQKMKSQHNFSDEFHMQLLATPRSKAEYSDMILEHLSNAQPKPPVTSHVQLVKAETDKIIPLVTEALVHRYAIAAPKVKLADDNNFATFSFMDSARYILGRNGYETLGQSNAQIYKLIQGREDFAAITENFASRMLMEGYTSEEKSFLPFTRIRETASFGRNLRARASRAPMPQKVINGVVPTGNLGPNEIEEYRAWAYSYLITLTREALIDDDLGQFGEDVWNYGAQVSLFEADLVYSQIINNPVMMADGFKLFSAEHKNFGKGETLDENGLSTAREAIRAQLDVNGNRLNLIMRNIVVGSRLETVAEKYTYADVVPNSAAAVNPFARSIRRIVDTVMDPNEGVWFATTASTQAPIVELAYLKGQQGPYIMSDTDIRIDGRMFRYGIDVGVKVVDWRGIWINKVPTVPMKDPSADDTQRNRKTREPKETRE